MICSTHGALYEPTSGRASAGRARRPLVRLRLEERDGAVVLQSRIREPWLTRVAGPRATGSASVIEKLALEALKEQRRARRWGIFFKLLTFAYVTVLLWSRCSTGGAPTAAATSTPRWSRYRRHRAGSDASAERVNAALQAAFKDKNTQGVVLRINSPGGSPVQAQIIYDEIRRLRGLHPTSRSTRWSRTSAPRAATSSPSAADRIYVDKASLVGSIGVLMDGFGFTGMMDKLGVERRVITAGENKAILDPFSPIEPRAGGARQGAARRDPPAVHRRGAQGARQAPEGVAGASSAA